MNSNSRQWIYGVLAIVGLVATGYFNLQFASEQGGFSAGAFIAGGYANPAAGSLTSDLMVAVLAFLVWILTEARRLEMPRVWIYVILTFGLAFAVSFPLFLLMRERHLAARAQAT